MKDLLILLLHLLTTIAKLLGPGGAKAVVADSLLKQRKYRLLYSTGRKAKPGPKGPSRELIEYPTPPPTVSANSRPYQAVKLPAFPTGCA